MSRSSDKAYAVIRDRIVDGTFPPGAHLKEEELAKICGVSRTPVRDALRNLASDFYVRIVPNHGTFVNEWSIDDVEDILTLRAALEGYAVSSAARKVNTEQLDIMRRCCNDIDNAIERTGGPDIDTFLSANGVFHRTIIEASGSRRLGLVMGQLLEPPVMRRTATLYETDQLERSNAHHREILEALEARDSRWAESVMVSHIFAALHAYKARQNLPILDSVEGASL